VKNLLYLFLIFLIFACSSNDERNQLFLENYDSVVWELDDSTDTGKITFMNSSKTFTIYDDVCATYTLEGTNTNPDDESEIVTMSIQEETENSISILAQTDDGGNFLYTFTVTIDGGAYKLTQSDAENDERIFNRIYGEEVCF
jgi:uncharacterized membrane protein|tara:strand:- start:120 stop:548 length:429 start_codon:yes stop_codon:yes gene_type:complete